jgi:hypothetical protein
VVASGGSTRRRQPVALTTPNDRTLMNVIAAYEREVMGRRLTINELTRLTESVKRGVLDEIHALKAGPA